MTSSPQQPPIIAGVGTRGVDQQEQQTLEKTGRWIARRGFRLRSGGARGADQAWARGAASINPELVTVCLPESSQKALRKRPEGAQVEIPPYPEWMVEIAIAEFVFRDKFPEVGLPPYQDPDLQQAFQERKNWKGVRRKARKKAKDKSDPLERIVLPNDAYVQRLMIRNVAILFETPYHDAPTEKARSVDLVLGMLSDKTGGGGTGHTFRIAQALDIPTFDLRDPEQADQAREALEQLEQQYASPAPEQTEPDRDSGPDTPGGDPELPTPAV